MEELYRDVRNEILEIHGSMMKLGLDVPKLLDIQASLSHEEFTMESGVVNSPVTGA